MDVRRLVLLTAAASRLGSSLAAPSAVRVRDAVPNYPVAPDTTPYCSWWWDNDGSISCEDMPDIWDITLDDFVRWNPSLAAGCSALKTDMSFCVEAADEPPVSTTAKPTSSTSTTASTSRSSSSSSSSSSFGIVTPTPIQPGMVDDCDAFYLVEQGDSCDTIASKNGISVTEFLKWNTNIGGRVCNGLWADAYVCVSVIGHTPTPTNPGNGIETPTPTQPGMVNNCDAFYEVVTGDSCDSIASENGISVAEFLEWNTEVGGKACSGLWAGAYVCVSIIGHTPTPTDPGNGIATPTPTQPGMVSNCDAFYEVILGDSCATIAAKNGVTVDQLAKWNDVGGTACTGLWANAYICVSIIGHTPTPADPGNGIATPSPIQDGMTKNCKTFHKVAASDTCASIASKYKITTAQFIKWNPAAKSDCTGLWANTYACVAVL
ncbi:hypothetical protein C7999DRAFT_14483 [Corynascus novoguineensis]|uniref:LysM domain-containing protein n=1 Tax=Corynascus novoguineensis TaxID=1126955 RepID=A0AAN7CTA2_9PEZI|nr:hypothetical protein C7999DRAFT_14483 [Corynascus novoguineensis]